MISLFKGNKKGLHVFDSMLDILLAVIFFMALFGVILTQINSGTVNWKAVNAGGTTYDFSWVTYVLIVLLVVVLIYFGLSKLKKKE